MRPEDNLPDFHQRLLAWFAENQRTYPWRYIDNPFHLLMSELMLRRTRADQVVAVYRNFVAKYPDAVTLASADADTVATDLYSLGLAWRIPAFQQLVHTLVTEFDGIVPDDYKALTSLPGVGDYVASAICSFAFGQPIAVIDTNTVRIIGRLYGIEVHAESRRKKDVRQRIQGVMNPDEPALHNFAMLDLAALVCTPSAPACDACPLQDYCAYGRA
ncbi:MAG: hypothetical protein AAF787_00445 [Chloroflexota bacterium]